MSNLKQTENSVCFCRKEEYTTSHITCPCDSSYLNTGNGHGYSYVSWRGKWHVGPTGGVSYNEWIQTL